MGKIINKMLNAIGFEGEEEEEEDFVFEEQPKEQPHKFSFGEGRKGRIVDIHTTTQLKVIVIQANKFSDVRDIADHLKTKKPVENQL